MNRSIIILFVLSLLLTDSMAQNATITLDSKTLMHEMRQTPSPQDCDTVSQRKVSFQWPLPAPFNYRGSDLDGLQESQPKPDKSKLRYKLRYSQSPDMEQALEVQTLYPFYNPDSDLAQGVWYWQYGYCTDEGTEWSKVLSFVNIDNPNKFCPPPFSEVAKGLTASHPRVIIDNRDWESMIARSHNTPERDMYLKCADEILSKPMLSLDNIASERAAELKNEVQRKAMLTRESRRIIDKEEANCNTLIRAYLLTKDSRYADEALRRIFEMAHWGDSKSVVGDFNDATLLSLCSEIYDAYYDHLTPDQLSTLLGHIAQMGEKMYQHHINRLENHIADNHVWQMTLRILSMAALTTYGEIEGAAKWADYCYNMWVARLPGLNDDGAWHNGDSYFHVNIRTLIELPYLYGRLSGFDFFSDPWYDGNILYVIYQQPPFSKSGGNGSSHQKILKPNGPRVSYAEALARLKQNSYAADYVRTVQLKEPNILMRNCTGKSGGLAWWRLQCKEQMPTEGPGLEQLPIGHVFQNSGLGSFSTDLKHPERSAMVSFRSSPYGSTSHAISNQNAFNTFYGGKPLFYSSGHHTAFVDRHAVMCHRASRAHNTILADGTNQRIGTEGYGWIPRQYVGERVGYILGDASNAYGEVISPIWLERAKAAGFEFSEENGWRDAGVELFRRHITWLADCDILVVYDELRSQKPIEWQYLLHTVAQPMKVGPTKEYHHITALNGKGASDVYIYSSGKMRCDTTSEFFVKADGWLKLDAKGNPEQYDNHYHLTLSSQRASTYRILTIIHTHPAKRESLVPHLTKTGLIEIGEWSIEAELNPRKEARFRVVSHDNTTAVSYRENDATLVIEDGTENILCDKLPKLEI